MCKFRAFFTTSLQQVFAYRARSFVWFLIDTLPVITSIFFVLAALSDSGSLGSYNRSSILLYYLIVMSLGTLTEAHPEFIVSQEINRGKLVTYLVKPLSYWRFRAADELAYKVARFVYLVPLVGIFLGLTVNSINFQEIRWWYGGTFLLMIGLSFWVYYFLKLIVGFMAFWFTEIWWLLGAIEIMNLLFSGFMIPIDLLPETFQRISAWLPFQYLVYFPAKTLLGEFGPLQLIKAVSIQLVWLIIIAGLARIIWRKGVLSYAAYGN